jgi:hypothetical protein
MWRKESNFMDDAMPRGGTGRTGPGQLRLDRETTLEGIPIRADLLRRLSARLDEPEQRVRLLWVALLVFRYGYDSRQIEIEVPVPVGTQAGRRGQGPRADIVVYRDKRRTEPFIVVETKRAGAPSGQAQAESYSRILGAEFYVVTDGCWDEDFFSSARHPGKSQRINDIPHSGGEVTRLPQTSGTPLDDFIRALAKLVRKGVLLEGRDFRVDGQMLWMNTAKAIHETGASRVLLQREMRESAKGNDYVRAKSKMVRIGERAFRSFGMHLPSVEAALQIPVSVWGTRG